MPNFNWATQVENVGHNDLITSEPFSTAQEQPTCEVSLVYHV